MWVRLTIINYVLCPNFLSNAGNQLPINNIVDLYFAISTRGQCKLNIYTSASSEINLNIFMVVKRLIVSNLHMS